MGLNSYIRCDQKLCERFVATHEPGLSVGTSPSVSPSLKTSRAQSAV